MVYGIENNGGKVMVTVPSAKFDKVITPDAINYQTKANNWISKVRGMFNENR